MGISLVQTAPNVALSGSSTSQTQTFSSATTVGNIVIVGATTNDTGGVTVSGGGVGCWVRVGGSYTGESAELWYGLVTTASVTTVTVTCQTAADEFPGCMATEWSGIIATTPPVLTYATVNGTATTAAGASVSATASGQLAIGTIESSSGGVASPYSAGAGWTALNEGVFTSGAAAYGVANYLITSGSGSVQPSWTQSSSMAYDSVTALFAPASGSSIAFVQAAPNTLLVSTSPTTQTFASNTTVGNCLIVCTTTNDTGGTIVSGGGVGVWAKVAESHANKTSEIWYGFVTTSGQKVVTVTARGGNVYPGCMASEWSGISLGPVLVSGVAEATSGTITGPSLTATGIGQLAVGVCEANAGVASPYSAGSGWTASNQGISSGSAFGLVNYDITTGSGSVQPVWTGKSSSQYNTIGAIFPPNPIPVSITALPGFALGVPVAGSVAAGVAVSASAGSALGVPLNASVAAGVAISASVATAIATGQAATPAAGVSIVAGLAQALATASPAAISAGANVIASTAQAIGIPGTATPQVSVLVNALNAHALAFGLSAEILTHVNALFFITEITVTRNESETSTSSPFDVTVTGSSQYDVTVTSIGGTMP